ncbi:MAG: cytochrome c maturation protein CcmE, partial [Aestuariivirga sp.]
MTRKQKRISVILAGVATLGLAVGLILYALRDAIVFFYTPSEIVEKNVVPGQRLRLGGLVETGSWKRGEGTQNSFIVTDTVKALSVT